LASPATGLAGRAAHTRRNGRGKKQRRRAQARRPHPRQRSLPEDETREGLGGEQREP